MYLQVNDQSCVVIYSCSALTVCSDVIWLCREDVHHIQAYVSPALRVAVVSLTSVYSSMVEPLHRARVGANYQRRVTIQDQIVVSLTERKQPAVDAVPAH